mgnify:FL=1
MEYEKNQKVDVNFFGKWLPGIIKNVFPLYGFSGERKYEIHGTKTAYLTITSKRLVRLPTQGGGHDL